MTDINLSLDDKFLYVSCWGTGEILQYDVSDPFNPKKTGSVRIGGIVNRTPHPKNPNQPLAGGPQMVEVSRDGKRVYFTNSLYAAWDEQFYPDGVGSWMVKLDAEPAKAASRFDENFFVESSDYRVHQIRLEGAIPRAIPSVFREWALAVADAVFGLGAFHGMNPAMGWLFAVGAWIAGTETCSCASCACLRSRWGTRFPLGSSSLPFSWLGSVCRTRA